MAQWVEVLATEADGLNSSLRAHMMKIQNQFALKVVP